MILYQNDLSMILLMYEFMNHKFRFYLLKYLRLVDHLKDDMIMNRYILSFIFSTVRRFCQAGISTLFIIGQLLVDFLHSSPISSDNSRLLVQARLKFSKAMILCSFLFVFCHGFLLFQSLVDESKTCNVHSYINHTFISFSQSFKNGIFLLI